MTLKMFLAVCVISLAVLIAPGSADVPEHVVESLPGWKGSLPSKQYSGYLRLDQTSEKYLHYWLVESENDPKSDPIVLWLNGGPGCSSLDGYFNEQGPLHFNRTSADNLTRPDLLYNPYTWTKIANVIFLESPVGVGFSYSDRPAVDYMMDDNQTALDNYHFLVNFFKSYPEYKNHEFFIGGESYAGIYVPTLVNTIRMMNDVVPADEKINLIGFLVGNGCVGNEVGGCGHETSIKIHVEFYHGHALFPDALYDEIIKECGDFSHLNESCSDKLNEMSKEIGKVNIYDIYEPCFSNLPPFGSRARNHLKEFLLSRQPGPYFGPDECIDDHVESKYFDNDTVRSLIHVKSKSDIGGWRLCTNKIYYKANTASLIPIYPMLIKTYRTLIFNGDVDGCVPFIGNEQWTSGLGFGVKEGWRPWLVDQQVAGYVTQYDENGFQFATVKGSGHMVPQFRPKQALALFQRFIRNQPL